MRKPYLAPKGVVVRLEGQDLMLGFPIVGSNSVSYPGGPGGSFDGDDEISVKRYNVWDDDWTSEQ